jgi:hypothetical protein
LYFAALARTATGLARRLRAKADRRGAEEVARQARALLESRAGAAKGVPRIPVEVAWFLLTCEPSELQDRRAALALAEKAAAEPLGDNAAVLATLAVARFENGDREGALSAALKVYALFPAAVAGRDAPSLRRDVLVNLERLRPQPSPRLWF